MLFNKKLESGVGYDYAPEADSRATGGGIPLNQSAEVLRHRAGVPARSVIDAWLIMTGNLQSEGDIQVDGKVEGHIRCRQLIVGKDATINGDVSAEEVVVRGKVKGVIRANRVKLQETACVESDVFFLKSLAIEDGASFEGQIRRAAEPVQIAEAPNASEVLGAAEPVGETGMVEIQSTAETAPRSASKSQARREREARALVANPG
jgi:cytoskeletal protein CcmA (bactofilin family)